MKRIFRITCRATKENVIRAIEELKYKDEMIVVIKKADKSEEKSNERSKSI